MGVLPSLLKQPGACEWTDDIEGGQPNVGAVSTFTATAVDRVHVSYFSSFDFEKLFGPASSSLALYASREMTDHYLEAAKEAEEWQLSEPIRANDEAQKLKRLHQGMPKKINEKTFLDVKPLVLTSTGMVSTCHDFCCCGGGWVVGWGDGCDLCTLLPTHLSLLTFSSCLVR